MVVGMRDCLSNGYIALKITLKSNLPPYALATTIFLI